MNVSVRIPYTVPLDKLPWKDYAQSLADLVKKGAVPQIVETDSDKTNHLD